MVCEWGGRACGVCVVEGRVVCGLWFFFFLPLPLPLPLCVGVRGSARAALRARTLSPNTIVSSAYCFSFLLAVPRLSSPVFRLPAFLLLEWRCVIHHVLVCCVGMTATGSLSLLSSFFW